MKEGFNDHGGPTEHHFDPRGNETLVRQNGEYFWRGQKLPGKPEILKDRTGGVTVFIPNPADPQHPLYKRCEDKTGKMTSLEYWQGEEASKSGKPDQPLPKSR